LPEQADAEQALALRLLWLLLRDLLSPPIEPLSSGLDVWWSAAGFPSGDDIVGQPLKHRSDFWLITMFFCERPEPCDKPVTAVS
jgi:hypothetical protein